jgi:subtilisin family serine protease
MTLGEVFMGKKLLKLQTVLALTALLLTAACGQNTDHQRIYGATESLKNPGLIVSGMDESSRDELLQAHPEAKFRVLSNNLSIYEFSGVTEQEIKEVSKNVVIERNEVVEFKSKKLDVQERIMNKLEVLSSSPQGFFAGCNQSPFLQTPEPELEPVSVQNSEYLQIGDVVRLTSPELTEVEKTAWFIMPPLGSGQETTYTEESVANVEFSMASSYFVALLYRRNNICNFEMFTLSPTDNIPLSDNVETPRRSAVDFYHLDIVNHASAISALNPTQETVVAVCDTGVNYNHPALRESIWINEEEVLDGIDNDGNGYIDDLYGYDFFYDDNMPLDDDGHGTHVAGLISGFEMGVAHGVSKVMALKVGIGQGLDVGSIIECISYATQKGANVINLSLGGSRPNRITEMVIESAREQGVLVVAAAGNGDSRGIGVNNDLTPVYPASYDLSNIITVASTDENGELTEYSNFGEMSVDIAAPGGYQTESNPVARQLLSAYVPNPEGVSLQPLSGTSMAAPIVAGSAALYLSEFPATQPEELIQVLKETGNSSNALVGKIESAAVLDINAALSSRKFLF